MIPAKSDRRAAVFIDRDGTLNAELPEVLARPAQLELLPGAAGALRDLCQAGFAIVLVTNQSAIARGALDHERLARVHQRLSAMLAQEGARLDLIAVCPHHESEGFPPYRRACSCRKPAPGLVRDAAQRLDLDLERSWIVGDAERDLCAGEALGATGILVATGKGQSEYARLSSLGRAPRFFDADLAAAAARILRAR